MARALIAVGVAAHAAHELAFRIEQDLGARGETAVDLDRVEELAGDDEAMRRLRRYIELRELDLPVIVLIGGATGTGKSAVDPAIAGFLEQSRNVLVGVRASLARALEEGWSMVLEGVHLVPGMVELPRAARDAVVATCVLSIDDADQHASHFYVRDATSEGVRPVRKYLDHFDEIRRIQEDIVARARRDGVPVLEATNLDRTVTGVLELVLNAAERTEKVT
jgi:2-phosphoglycerate kinase